MRVGSDPTGRYLLRILRLDAWQLRVPRAGRRELWGGISRRVCVHRPHPRTDSTHRHTDSESNHPHTESTPTGSDWPALVLCSAEW